MVNIVITRLRLPFWLFIEEIGIVDTFKNWKRWRNQLKVPRSPVGYSFKWRHFNSVTCHKFIDQISWLQRSAFVAKDINSYFIASVFIFHCIRNLISFTSNTKNRLYQQQNETSHDGAETETQAFFRLDILTINFNDPRSINLKILYFKCSCHETLGTLWGKEAQCRAQSADKLCKNWEYLYEYCWEDVNPCILACIETRMNIEKSK